MDPSNTESKGKYFVTKVTEDNTCIECGYYARAVSVKEFEKHGLNCTITSRKHGRGY